MYARTTLLEIDTMRVSIDDATTLLQDAVMPRLQRQTGFCGFYAFATLAGKAMLISFWETAEQADAGSDTGWYPEVLSEYMTLFRAPPGREHYEVRVAVPPSVPVGTTS